MIFPLLALLAVAGLFMAACEPTQPQISTTEPSSSVEGPPNTQTSGTESSTEPQIPTDTETSGPPVDPTQPDPMVCHMDIPYGAHPLQTMDIYIPEGSPDARYPVVLTVHGGEWSSGDKSEAAQYTATVIAAQCIHVSINYRLLYNGIPRDAERPYEIMLDDIGAAFDFLAQNADMYQIDTEKAGIAGYSSGGHLALLYAFTRTASAIPVHFVVSEAGPANFMDPKTFTEDGETWIHEGHNAHEDIEVWPNMPRDYRLVLIGDITGTQYGKPGWEEAWSNASPAHVVTASSPKTYLFYGSHDAMVPISHAELLMQNHPDCSLYEVFGAAHHLYSDPGDLQRFRSWLREILENF